jgi:uncharacterized damage-inducible protein DinB
MTTSLAPLAAIFELNTDLLLNCIDGLSDDASRRRLPGGGNSAAFLTAHLTESRHFAAANLGRPLANPLAALLAGARGIEDVRDWPPLSELREAWLGISSHLRTVLAELPAGELSRPSAHRFPASDGTMLGMLTFLAQHDSYHVGQLAFLRRQLGMPAMSYARPEGRS